MVALNEQTPTYDLDGNMLTLSNDGVLWNLTWNGENRLIVAESADKRLEFTYDYMGRRVSKQVYTGSVGNWTLASESKYVYDGWNCIAIFNGSDVMQKSYLWGEDLSGSLQGAGGVGGLLAVNDAVATYFPMYDGNGNIMTYVDPSGTLKADYTYDPFGRIIDKSGTLAEDFLYRFSTKQYEKNLDAVMFEIRILRLGRWLSKDPIEEDGGVNLYGFVGNNPIGRWDYLGMEEFILNEDKKTLTRKYNFTVKFHDRTDFVADGTRVYLSYNLRSRILVDRWTQKRKENFVSGVESSAESSWNNQKFKVCKNGETYSLELDLVKSNKFDWLIHALANSRSGEDKYNSKTRWHRSSNNLGGPNGYFDESAAYSPHTVAHELGHQFGLHHPGYKRGSNPEDEYDTPPDGLDYKKRKVNENDLMGRGMEMRAFYFEDWKKYMDRTYGKEWKIIE